ncbi:MAG: thioredoxin domain-containing protein [Gammaproteobacteria bacterium]|nr:thioredoxin domain-containing protein [Gammaproteobacteria bacterium]
MKKLRWFGLCLLVLLTGCIFDDGTYKVGMTVPSLRTKTLEDVGGDLTRITTYRYPDKRMYQHSLDEALLKEQVIVLVFATPGHCTQCDKHLQMLKAALDKFEDDVLFLHMDQYQNPEAFNAFKVIGDPWTFIIDTKQTVRVKRAGRMLLREVDVMVASLLKEGAAQETVSQQGDIQKSDSQKNTAG